MAQETNEFLDMDLTQLMNITITSVSKKPEPLVDAAAAVFVITQEDIQRTGVTTIQDALRLAPGVHVARIGADKWAVTTRGFNGRYSNKLLVLMDGRTLYSPAFAGVYWSMQGTLLEDIDRIEIIRGPGATLWGANAVNGVINIMTKKSGQTQGGLIRVAGGNADTAHLGARYGWTMGERTNARAYLIYDEKDSFTLMRDGSDAKDDWDSTRAGFRIDGEISDLSSWTFQGDIYESSINQVISPYWLPNYPYISELEEQLTASGWNILGRYDHKLSDVSSFSVQMYIDNAERDEAFLPQRHDTYDIDINFQTELGQRNQISLGAGYRRVDAEFDNSFQGQITPSEREDTTYSGYLQDSVSLVPDSLIFTVGTKWEKNEYTDHEWQPSARFLWKPQEDTSIWVGVSRAVKVPSQFENSGSLVAKVVPTTQPTPTLFTIMGSKTYESEEVIAYEVGYRWFPDEKMSFDLAFFYNEYDMLLDSRIPIDAPTTSELSNDINGQTYGVEMAVDWKALDWLTFNLSYSFMQLAMDTATQASSVSLEVYEGSAPKHMISLLSQMSLSTQWDVNLWLRYVDELAIASITADSLGIIVDDYVDADLIVNYSPSDCFTVSLVGQNLLHSEKIEFISEYFTPPTEVGRSVYLKATWKF